MQIEQFEVVKAKKDERIASLSKDLDAANQNATTLKKTLDDLIKTQASSERAFKGANCTIAKGA